MIDVAIIGAGQAGLATAYCLRQIGTNPVLIEAAPEIGTSWLERYDSLKLFTPSQYSNLPGMPFPARADHYPTKDEVADYLRAYAARFDLNVRTGLSVSRLSRGADSFLLDAGSEQISTKAVIVATGALQKPSIPAFGTQLHPSVNQWHSSEYRNPAMIPDGDVLIVGGGNSGAQIADELAKAGRAVSVSIGEMPRHLPQRFLGKDIFWWLTKSGLISTKPAKIVGSKASTPIPTIGTDLKRLSRTGAIRIVPRVVGVDAAEVVFADQSRLVPTSIIWATGFVNDFSWIEIEGTFAAYVPLYERGVSPVKGLFFIGQPFLYSKGSAFLGFVEDDAWHVANAAFQSVESARVSQAV